MGSAVGVSVGVGDGMIAVAGANIGGAAGVVQAMAKIITVSSMAQIFVIPALQPLFQFPQTPLRAKAGIQRRNPVLRQ